MSEALASVLVALLGGSGLVSGIFSIINTQIARKAARSDKQAEIEQRITALEMRSKKNELDDVRLQILVLLADYPDDRAEIMRVAEHYFSELKGNWYMTSIFNKWLETNEIAKPEWFKND